MSQNHNDYQTYPKDPNYPPPPYTPTPPQRTTGGDIPTSSSTSTSVPIMATPVQNIYYPDQQQYREVPILAPNVVLMTNSRTAFYGPHSTNYLDPNNTRVVHLYAVRRRNMIIRGISLLVLVIVIIILFSIIFG